MLEGLVKKVYLAVAMFGLFGVAFAAKVAPLYFESLGSSATENATTQQEYWEGLMKYKLWGSEGLTFNKHTVHIADKNGYNGTATGDISFFNGAHHQSIAVAVFNRAVVFIYNLQVQCLVR